MKVLVVDEGCPVCKGTGLERHPDTKMTIRDKDTREVLGEQHMHRVCGCVHAVELVARHVERKESNEVVPGVLGGFACKYEDIVTDYPLVEKP